MLGRILGTALSLASISCGPVDRCLDQEGPSFNYQISASAISVTPSRGRRRPASTTSSASWRVVGYREPGISALSSEQAAAWLGKRETYELKRCLLRWGEPALSLCSSARSSPPSSSPTLSFRFPRGALGLAILRAGCITEIELPRLVGGAGLVLRITRTHGSSPPGTASSLSWSASSARPNKLRQLAAASYESRGLAAPQAGELHVAPACGRSW